jgi:hypothetical protein
MHFVVGLDVRGPISSDSSDSLLLTIDCGENESAIESRGIIVDDLRGRIISTSSRNIECSFGRSSALVVDLLM